jgi:hypothetical protein
MITAIKKVKANMKPSEYISKAFLNGILLSASAWDFITPAIQLMATMAGIVLTVFLIRKAWHDTLLTKERKRETKLLNDLRELELKRKL